MVVAWPISILSEELIMPILYDPTVNNAASTNNIYLCWKREEWSSIIKNFESPL